MKRLIIDFAGHLVIDAETTRFVNSENCKEVITGMEYSMLPQYARNKYVLSSLAEALQDSDDYELEHINIEAE